MPIATGMIKGQAYQTPDGKKVYGGGGITPDIFVAIDTAGITDKVARLYTKNTIGNFVYNYYVENIDQFKLFTDPPSFEKGFDIDNNVWNALISFAAKDSVSLNNLSTSDKVFLRQRLKSLFARQQWRNEGFYEVNNVNDLIVKKALEELNK